MAAAVAPPPAGGAAPLGPPPLSFLQTLQRNPNVSAACIAGVNEVLQNTTRARMAEYFSGKVAEGLSLILPFVLQDLAFATDKRAGLGHFVEQPPLWSLGVPDSCGYIGLSYCQVDTVPILAKWGVCVPASCTIQDVFTAIFPPATKKLAERIKGRCGPLHADRTLFITREPWPAGAIVTLTLLVVLLAAVLLATAIDVYGNDTGIPWLRSNDADDTASDNHDSHSLVVKLARCFSLRQNYRRLMAPPRSGPFLCLDAVRVLSMLMILLGHTLYYEQSVTGLTNPREAMGFHNRGFLSTGVGLIANGCLFGVDTFLALAGFLAVLLFMKELGKRLPHAHGGRQRASLVTRMALGSYLRRYLRLTPAYAVVLAVFTTLAPMLSSAPPSPTDLFHETGVCARKWWENLLYVNNILSTTYTMCYLPSYFLCIIQQLFLLVPWLALVALRRPRAALALCLLACVGSYVHSFQTAQRQGWRLNGLDRPGFPNFYTNFYTRTFARMPTFLIGGMGAILWHHYGARFQAFLSSGGRWVGALKAWGIVAAGLAILAAAEFGPHDEMAYAPGRWPQTRSSVFITLCWSAWALGLAMVCAVVFAGRGGPLKALLELPLWSPLARLVFATYLVHPMTIQVVIASRGGAPAHFSLVYLFYQFVGYSAVSGLAAFLFYMWVEGPFGELERLLFHRPSSRAGGSKSGKKEGTEAAEVEKPASVVVVPVQLTEAGEGSGSAAAAVAQ